MVTESFASAATLGRFVPGESHFLWHVAARTFVVGRIFRKSLLHHSPEVAMRLHDFKWTRRASLLAACFVVASMGLLQPLTTIAAERVEKFEGWRVGSPFTGSMGTT